jgi:hypothetical protein
VNAFTAFTVSARCKRKRHGMPWRFFFGGLTVELL